MRKKQGRLGSTKKPRKNKVDDATDDDKDEMVDEVECQKLKLKTKVTKMIEAYEMNLKLKESLIVDDSAHKGDAYEKAKVENAFERLMASGRRSTPSPGKRKLKKRLDHKQPREQNSLLRFWLGKEKN